METKVLTSLFSLLTFSVLINGQTIEQIGNYDAHTEIRSISSKANLMILGNGQVVDISDPSLPQVTDTIPLYHSNAVLISGNVLISLRPTEMFSDELYIANISNPNSCDSISGISFPYCRSVTQHIQNIGNIAYVSSSGCGIYTIDLSNIESPKYMDSLLCRADDFSLNPPYAYIASDDSLLIIDISDPANLQVLASIEGSFYIFEDYYDAIDINDNLAFLGRFQGGVDVFNIADPINPYPAFSISTRNKYIRDIKCFENRIYLTDSWGLSVFELGNNEAILIDSFPDNDQDFLGGEICLQDSLILMELYQEVAILFDPALDYQGNNNGIVRTSDLEGLKKLNIFPNPVNNNLYIEINDQDKVMLEIFNSNGKIVQSRTIHSSLEEIDVSRFTEGIYLIKVTQGNAVYVEKVVVK